MIGSPVVSLTIPLTTICWANVLTDKNNPTMNISRTLNVAFLFMSLYINALILFILFGKIPIETIQPFYLLFYNLLIPFNSDLSFTSLMLIA